MSEIGATLREARMRARIDLSEIEAQTKIRGRYLRALENEEWDLLPGPTFVKSFLRTYATALGLDGKALLEEYRREYEHSGEAELQPMIAPRRRRGGEAGDQSRRPGGLSPGYVVAIGVVGLVIVFLVIGLLTHGASKPTPASHTKTTAARRHQGAARRRRRRHGSHGRSAHAGTPARSGSGGRAPASVYLQASSTVWVCLTGEGVRGHPASAEGEPGTEPSTQAGAGTEAQPGGEREVKLIPGIDLQAGETSGPYHGRRFKVTLGKSAVTLRVNGSAVAVPESTTPTGYEITGSGASPLSAARQPTCG